jgi:hypothetical protein
MAATLGSLIDAARNRLSGFDATREGVAALTAAVIPGDLKLRVSDLTDAAVGTAEVDLELMRVRQVDASNSELLLYPFGRGYRGTTEASHALHAEVSFNPPWPASSIAREINGVLTEIYPRVYGVASHEGVTNSNLEHAIPDEAVGVISVWVLDSAAPTGWAQLGRWSFDRHASDTGMSLRLPPLPSGQRYRVVYATRPGTFDLDGPRSQDFATATGLDERLIELVLLGVAARMAPYVDVARLPFTTSAVRTQGEASPPNAGASVTRLLYSMYQSQLEQEALILGRENPIRRHRAVN